jgi:hypothetical protein
MRAHRMIFTAGPWHPDWGDQDRPRHVAGIKVARGLLHRESGGGGLVILTDGRFALTGSTYAIGTARAVMRDARSKSRAASVGERAWLLMVAEELRRRSRKRRFSSGEGARPYFAATPSTQIPH